MQTILIMVHIVLAIALIGLILLQHGRGADAGAAFGSGASATVFGARGSGSFLSRTTTALAILFFANSLALAYLSAHMEQAPGLMDRIESEQVAPGKEQEPAPAEKAPAAGDVPLIAPTDAPAEAPPAGK
ncbi:MAG TPA: preprotein translocase subunit SecG [Gammaproteobacteria bacterium]|nr:preprotein translocase subunit SecG [Gammaproteobacteria bacterium]